MNAKQRAEKIHSHPSCAKEKCAMFMIIVAQIEEAEKEAVDKATKAHADHVHWRCKLCIAEGFNAAKEKAAGGTVAKQTPDERDKKLFQKYKRLGCKPEWYDGIFGWAYHCGCPDNQHGCDSQCSDLE